MSERERRMCSLGRTAPMPPLPPFSAAAVVGEEGARLHISRNVVVPKIDLPPALLPISGADRDVEGFVVAGKSISPDNCVEYHVMGLMGRPTAQNHHPRSKGAILQQRLAFSV